MVPAVSICSATNLSPEDIARVSELLGGQPRRTFNSPGGSVVLKDGRSAGILSQGSETLLCVLEYHPESGSAQRRVEYFVYSSHGVLVNRLATEWGALSTRGGDTGFGGNIKASDPVASTGLSLFRSLNLKNRTDFVADSAAYSE